MKEKYCFKFNKLIRDHLPDHMRANAISVIDQILKKEAYVQQLKYKLVEEVNEANASDQTEDLLEELSDVLEIIHALGKCYNLSFDCIDQKRIAKKQSKGGFEKRIYVEHIEMDANCFSLSYYRSKSNDYPEI